MSDTEKRVQLLIVDVAVIAGQRDRLVVAERLTGESLEPGMTFRSPDLPGKWRITELGHFTPCEPGKPGNREPLAMVELTPGCVIREGIRLFED